MDYCFITDKSEESEDDGVTETTGGGVAGDENAEELKDPEEPVAVTRPDGEAAEVSGEGQSATVLVMQESENRSVWAYGVQNK